MNIIGHFRREDDGFVGRVVTLSIDAAVRVSPLGKVSSKAPDFVVLRDGVECGVAWRATDNNGAILNLKLDDPAWAEPVNARLMAAEDGDLPLTWIRRTDAVVDKAPPSDRPPPT